MLILSSQRYECQQCGRCCRRFLIPISQTEIEAISKLPWQHATDAKIQCYTSINGRSFLKADAKTAECVFLENGTKCRMHAAFGSKCKTISCRAYPFEFMRTFGDDITVAGRFDCPAIQSNSGKILEFQRFDLEELLADPLMHALPPPISPLQMDGLTRNTIEFLADTLKDIVLKGDTTIPAIALLVRNIRRLGYTFANDLDTLKEVLPSMLDKARRKSFDDSVIGINWPARNRLRDEMLRYLRYDRQAPDFSIAARLKQLRLSAEIFAGCGNPRSFGPEQPNVTIRTARLFDNDFWHSEENAWECYRRFLSVRLESRQFFASAYYGKSFFDGLDALFKTWDAALLLSRLHAASVHPGVIDSADVAYATGLIDHYHGRRIKVK